MSVDTPPLVNHAPGLVLKRHHGPFTVLCGSNYGIAEGMATLFPNRCWR